MPHVDIVDTPYGEKLLLTCFLTDQSQAKRVPGSNWSDSYDGWLIPPSFGACLILRYLFEERLTVGDRLSAASQQWASTAAWRTYLSGALERPSTAPWLEPWFNASPDGLYPFQQVDTAWMSLANGNALTNEPGLGKTISAIAELVTLEKMGMDVRPILVVCPTSVKNVWQSELAKWAPAWGVSVVTGGAGRRRDILEQVGDVFVIGWQTLRYHTRLAPYGSVRLKRCPAHGGEYKPNTDEPVVTVSQCEAHEKELNMIPFGTVILDEAHRLQHPESKQTRAAWWMTWQAKRRLALTGTPTGNTIEDVWPILHAIDPVAFPTKGEFVDLFATTEYKFFGGFETLGLKPETRNLYYKVTGPYMRRVQKKAVLPQLPDKIFEYRYPEMSAKQRKIYIEMRDEMLAHLEELVVAPNPLAQAQRLSMFAGATPKVNLEVCPTCKQRPARQGESEPWQIVNKDPHAGMVVDFIPCDMCTSQPGWVLNPEWGTEGGEAWLTCPRCEGVKLMESWMTCPRCNGTEEIQVIELIAPSCKVDDLLEFIRDEGEERPLVVSSESKRLLMLASAKLTAEKIPHQCLTGDVPEGERPALVKRFQDGHMPIILMTPQTGGEGITLTRADTIFVMMPSYNARANLQVIDRVHRNGSEMHENIRVITQVTPGTVDERKEEVLSGKAERIDEVTRDKERLKWLLGG